MQISALLVEDDPADAIFVRTLVEDRPEIAVHHVERVDQALAYCRRNNVDVVLLDLSLPDACGLNGVEQMTQSAPQLAVVVLTGNSDDLLAHEALQSGAQDYLLKEHIDAGTLQRSIRYAMERKRFQRDLEEANLELERRVEKRTLQLQSQYQQLIEESSERRRAEEELTRARQEVIETRTQFIERVLAAQDDERRRIAREFHDSVGQGLTSLIAGLSAEEERDPLAASRTRPLRRLAEQVLKEVSQVVRGLHPTLLDSFGLFIALEQQVERLREISTIEWTLRFSEDFRSRRLSPRLEINIYRVVQECLTNIVKHATATRAGIDLCSSDDTLFVTIRDDGCGMTINPATGLPGTPGLGTVGIQERLTLLGGQLRIESTPGAGTSVHVVTPLEERLDEAHSHPARR